MATHSSILAWRIPGTEEICGLPSMGLHRVTARKESGTHPLYHQVLETAKALKKGLLDTWTLQEVPLEEEMATHSSILAWGSPWTEEPGRLQSMGSQRVRHD